MCRRMDAAGASHLDTEIASVEAPRRRGPKRGRRCRICASHRQAAARRGEILRGKNILIIRTTGFVGKVALSIAAPLSRRRPYLLPRSARRRQHRRRAVLQEGRDPEAFVRCATCAAPYGLHAVESSRFPAHRPAAVQLHRRAVRLLRPRRRSARDHQQRRPGVVRAVARERAADQRDGRQECPRRRAQGRGAAVPRVDVLRRRPPRGRGVGGRAGGRLLPALEARSRAIWGKPGRAARSRLRPGGRDRRLPEGDRSGARALETIASTSRSSASAAPRRCASSGAIPTTRTISRSRSRASARSG